jgi:hypothetical protein
VAKGGYYCDLPAHLDRLGVVYGDALGRRRDGNHVPFVRHMWARTAELALGHRAVSTRALQRRDEYNLGCVVAHDVCDETYRMLQEVYGLTREQEALYETMIGRVTALPSVVDFAPLHAALAVDGVLDVDPAGDQVPGSRFAALQEE